MRAESNQVRAFSKQFKDHELFSLPNVLAPENWVTVPAMNKR